MTLSTSMMDFSLAWIMYAAIVPGRVYVHHLCHVWKTLASVDVRSL